MAVNLTSSGVGGLTYPGPHTVTNGNITIGAMSILAFSSGRVYNTYGSTRTITAPSGGTYFKLLFQNSNGSGGFFESVSGGAQLNSSSSQYTCAAIFRVA